MASNTVIQVEGLWKRYGLPLRPAFDQARDRLLGRLDTSPEAYGPWALKDLSFEVRQGEILGIVGRNGAGKSTLLKVLAGVTRPTRGQYRADGQIFPMIELTAGMHQELTGFENIYLLGAMMGLSRREVRAGLDAMVAFSELGEWLERPVRMYSSGMLVRLGFAVAVNINADILLVDEVLAVGDLAFRAKCYDYIRSLQQNGTTVLFVSHSIAEVRRICNRALLLSQGRLVMNDLTDTVIAEYVRQSQDSATAKLMAQSTDTSPVLSENSGQIRLAGVKFLDDSGAEVEEPVFHRPLTMRLMLEVLAPVKYPLIYAGFETPAEVFAAFVRYVPPEDAPMLYPGFTYIDCRFDKLTLMPGSYSVYAALEDANGIYKLDQARHLRQVQVAPNPDDRVNLFAGFAHLGGTWQPETTPAPDSLPLA